MDSLSLSLIRLALREDLAGHGDLTSRLTIDERARATARVVAREEVVVSGTPLATAVLAEVDGAIDLDEVVSEGEGATAGDVIARISGPARSVLSAERTFLNFLARTCAVATQARRFARAVEGTSATVVDTRKTTPGLRLWEKRAVRHGGCGNHRFGLFDLVLIKDNHISAAGSVRGAVSRARATAPFCVKIEVEVGDEAGLNEALEAGADVVMLDNLSPEITRLLVARARERAPGVLLEASGRISLQTVRAVAETGVDVISTSALTVGAPHVDLGLDFV
ncbi:MAG: carboxylating nicotinate-nucleotide diphosphorylase [Thermoleophilia bacterium]|nr:carboxylating nicotinate-nucleotide diphosphorylase [Thermoleophilia bacterium]